MKNLLMLKIGGFNIRLVFNDSKKSFIKNTLRNEIADFFHGFIIKNPSKKPDYVINFIEKKKMEVLYNGKGKKYYLEFFEDKGINRMTAYYSINPLQFQTLINFILFKLASKHKMLFLKSKAFKKNGKADIFFNETPNKKNNFLTDDISIIRDERNKYYFYQSPFIENPLIPKNHKKILIGNVYLPSKKKIFPRKKINNKGQILRILAEKVYVDGKSYDRQIQYLMAFVESFDNFYYIQ